MLALRVCITQYRRFFIYLHRLSLWSWNVVKKIGSSREHFLHFDCYIIET